MRFLVFNSENIAQEVAWQLRAINFKKLVILLKNDPPALKLAIALAGGKCVKSWKLFPIVAQVGLLLLVCFEIAAELNHPHKLRIFTEDRLTHLYICDNKSFDTLKLAIDCNNQAKKEFDRLIHLD